MLKKHFVFDREYFKTLIAVALPIAMQNVINHGVSAMDTIMLGELGDIAGGADDFSTLHQQDHAQ